MFFSLSGTIPSLSVFSLVDLHLCMRTVNKLALTVPVDDPSLARGIVCVEKGGYVLYFCMCACMHLHVNIHRTSVFESLFS